MPGPYTVSQTTTRDRWWLGWVQHFYRKGNVRMGRRAKERGMVAFCRRHDLPVPPLPDRKRGAR